MADPVDQPAYETARPEKSPGVALSSAAAAPPLPAPVVSSTGEDHSEKADTVSSTGMDDGVVRDEEKGTAQDSSPLDEPPPRSKGKIAVIMLALMLAVFLAALDVTIVTTALPTISEHFHSASGYTWIGSAFLLANAASIPSWGKISDMYVTFRECKVRSG